MAQTESARAEAFAKQADRSREITLGYVQQSIANANAVRQMKASLETALGSIGIAHRWNATSLELLSPTTGQWVTGPDLRGTDVDSAELTEAGNLIITLSTGEEIQVGEGFATTAALALKAPLNSPDFTGTPTVPTAALGTNTTQAASTAFVRGEVAALVDAAPGTLDTLNELAAALGDDANFAATIAADLAAKQEALDLKLATTALDSTLQGLFTSRATRFNFGMDGLGAVVAFGRNAHNANAEYSGLQIGGGYARDGVHGVTVAPDGQSSWIRMQPSRNLSPMELYLYPTLAQGFASCVAGGNQITYISGSSYASFAVGKKFYFAEGVYLISANTGTVITVTELDGSPVSFAETVASEVFNYGYYSGSGICSISGTTATRIIGDPFPIYYTEDSFVFKTGGTAQTVTGGTFDDPETYTLSAGPGDTASVAYSFEFDIADTFTRFSVHKLLGSSEESLSLYASYDGYRIQSGYSGSGKFRKISIQSGFGGGRLHKQVVVQKNGDLTLGGDYGYDAIRILAPDASAVNGWQTKAAATGNRVLLKARGTDTNIGATIDTKGTGNVYFTQDETRVMFRMSAAEDAVNYIETTASAAGTAAYLIGKGSATTHAMLTGTGAGGIAALGSNTGAAKVSANATGVAFNGNTPIAKPTLAADATDLATVITLANDIKTKLVAYGLAA